MLKDRAMREKVKKYLVISSGILAVIFIILALYGLLSVRPNNIEKATQLGQYYEFDSGHLPNGEKVIEEKELYLDRTNSAHEKEGNSAAQILHEVRPKVSIIVTNLGLNTSSAELALSLPKEIALGFLPYSTNLKSFIHKAHHDGHDILMYMPFETKRYPNDDPGQMPLLTSNSSDENLKRMNYLLGQFHGYFGIYAAPNEVFTSNNGSVGGIITELSRLNLKLLVSRSGAEDLTFGEYAGIISTSDLIIDSDPNIVHIKKQLDKLVAIAKEKGSAIGYMNSYPVTIYTLKAWISGLEASGIDLVPVSHLMKNANGSAKDATHK